VQLINLPFLDVYGENAQFRVKIHSIGKNRTEKEFIFKMFPQLNKLCNESSNENSNHK